MTTLPSLRRPLMVAALALLTTAGIAHGHADVDDSGFKRNSKGAVTVHIEHGCGAENAAASAVDRVVVLVPNSFSTATPKSVKGWRATMTMTAEGHRMEWKRVARKSTAKDFGIRVRFPANAGVYGLPTVQYCGKASIAWIEKPVDGEEPEHPLPTVTVN
jgi:uncharacterized protein YcnI